MTTERSLGVLGRSTATVSGLGQQAAGSWSALETQNWDGLLSKLWCPSCASTRVGPASRRHATARAGRVRTGSFKLGQHETYTLAAILSYERVCFMNR